mmetsp:Transcript_45534/g.120298  ORF Transcript_45534/g.120298 Transcript_45534/m.120298 type:complete len:232 (-) Transcript_45534:3-698(-)
MGHLNESELCSPEAVSETLKCPLCFEIFDNPVFCSGRPCQHVFCRACYERALEQSSQCPSCRAEVALEDLQPHQVVNSLLDEMIVRCERSCGWTGRRDARALHAQVCPVARLEAQNEKLAQYEDVSRQLAARDARIAELEARVAEQDNHVVNVSRQLFAQKLRIEMLEAQLKVAQKEVAQRESEAELAFMREGSPGTSLPGSPSGPSGLSGSQEPGERTSPSTSAGHELWL